MSLADLVKTLQNTPNLLLWIAGHRHVNTVKAFPSADPAKPEQGFWQVETSSLRDFPQQFRTFEIYLNGDYTVSMVTVNVDPAVAEGTPAATSRRHAIAVQQIVQNELNQNSLNYSTAGGTGKLPVPSMDPTRPQSDAPQTNDPTIQYVDLSKAAVPVPCHGSYNAELFKQLSPQMIGVLKKTIGGCPRFRLSRGLADEVRRASPGGLPASSGIQINGLKNDGGWEERQNR